MVNKYFVASVTKTLYLYFKIDFSTFFESQKTIKNQLNLPKQGARKPILLESICEDIANRNSQAIYCFNNRL